MFAGVRKPSGLRKVVGRPRGCALAIAVLLTMGGVAAGPAVAWSAPFQRGDVFTTGSGSVQEHSPDGQLVQTLPGTSGARMLCFDPSGGHLILPGIGLFDSSGNLLPSNWASLPIGDGSWPVDCVADGFGNVYAYSSPDSPLTKYGLEGDVLQTFNVVAGTDQFAIDLAPDGCTIYYSAWQASLTSSAPFSGPFNVCTNTQES